MQELAEVANQSITDLVCVLSLPSFHTFVQSMQPKILQQSFSPQVSQWNGRRKLRIVGNDLIVSEISVPCVLLSGCIECRLFERILGKELHDAKGRTAANGRAMHFRSFSHNPMTELWGTNSIGEREKEGEGDDGSMLCDEWFISNTLLFIHGIRANSRLGEGEREGRNAPFQKCVRFCASQIIVRCQWWLEQKEVGALVEQNQSICASPHLLD